MEISTGLPQRSLRKSKREKVHDDGGNPLSVVNVELRAFEKRNQPTDDTAKTNNDSVKRWANYCDIYPARAWDDNTKQQT